MGNICEECGGVAEIGDICHECTVSGIETPLRSRIAELQQERNALKAENAALDESLRASVELNEQYAMQNAELRGRLEKAEGFLWNVIDESRETEDRDFCVIFGDVQFADIHDFLNPIEKEAQCEENSGD